MFLTFCFVRLRAFLTFCFVRLRVPHAALFAHAIRPFLAIIPRGMHILVSPPCLGIREYGDRPPGNPVIPTRNIKPYRMRVLGYAVGFLSTPPADIGLREAPRKMRATRPIHRKTPFRRRVCASSRRARQSRRRGVGRGIPIPNLIKAAS